MKICAIVLWHIYMASNGGKRGSRKAGNIPAPVQHAGAGGRASFSRALAHPSPAALNFQGFGGSGGGNAGFAAYPPGGGGAGWAPGLGPIGFDDMATGADVGILPERGDSFAQIIAYLQIMTPIGPEPLCCVYISSIHISLHQLRSEITSQLPAAHLPSSWNFAKLTVNEGAMFVPLQQERSMNMSLYISQSGVPFYLLLSQYLFLYIITLSQVFLSLSWSRPQHTSPIRLPLPPRFTMYLCTAAERW